jgi:hypothetical protein
LPLASKAFSVSVILEPELTLLEETVTVDVEAEIAPGTTVTAGSELVTFTPPIVA